MRSGNLKCKIEFMKLGEIKNAYGEVESGLVLFASAYASIVPVAGKEYFASKQTNAEVSHKIDMRYMSGISPDMLIVFGERKFNIESSLNIREANKSLQIMAVEVFNG